MTWQFTLSGLLIGMLVGLTGMGGGSLLTPILVIFFGFQPTLAVGTDVLHGAIFKSFGAVRHRQLGNVQARLSVLDVPRLGADVARSASGWRRGSAHHYGDSVDSIDGRVLGAALIFGGFGLAGKERSSSADISRTTRRSSLTAANIASPLCCSALLRRLRRRPRPRSAAAPSSD